jgi:hypothetical protein
MRLVRILGGISLLFMIGLTAQAQPAPGKQTVTVPEVEVRSGPSAQFYATGKLRLGDTVEVVRIEEGGAWLAVKPPEGSVSWINERFIERSGATAKVVGTDVPVRPGVSGQLDEAGFKLATVERVKLQPGSLLVIAGPPVTAADGNWWPIQPAAPEVRYLPAEAIKASAPVQTVSSVAPASAPQASVSVPSLPAGNEPLWIQAQQAEQAGNYAEAEQLYNQLARQTPDHDLAVRCFNRIQFLRERTHAGAAPAPPPGYPAQAYYPNAPAGHVPLSPIPSDGHGSPYPPAPAPGASGSPNGPYPAGQAPPVGYGQAPPPAMPSMQASGRGWLRRAGFYLDNKPTYVLQSTEGRPPLYVTAQGQLNLECYLQRNVELYGPMVYRGDVKANYMTAAHIALIP